MKGRESSTSITAFVAVILWTLVLVIIYVSQVDDVRTVNRIDKIRGWGGVTSCHSFLDAKLLINELFSK